METYTIDLNKYKTCPQIIVPTTTKKLVILSNDNDSDIKVFIENMPYLKLKEVILSDALLNIGSLNISYISKLVVPKNWESSSDIKDVIKSVMLNNKNVIVSTNENDKVSDKKILEFVGMAENTMEEVVSVSFVKIVNYIRNLPSQSLSVELSARLFSNVFEKSIEGLLKNYFIQKEVGISFRDTLIILMKQFSVDLGPLKVATELLRQFEAEKKDNAICDTGILHTLATAFYGISSDEGLSKIKPLEFDNTKELIRNFMSKKMEEGKAPKIVQNELNERFSEEINSDENIKKFVAEQMIAYRELMN